MTYSNESGLHPVEYKVLIQLPPEEEKTKGGIVIPSQYAEKMQIAREVGTFIEAGCLAFTDPDWPEDARPKPGDMVLFDRYAGSVQIGKDKKRYRIINDKEIGALVEE